MPVIRFSSQRPFSGNRTAAQQRQPPSRALLLCSASPSSISSRSSGSSSSSTWKLPALPALPRLSLPAAGALACSLLLAAQAQAAQAPDTAAVGKCLLSNCQGALAGCLADGGCLKNLVCLQACNDAPDVTACQIRCGDLYADKAIDVFNSCAVSSKKCVPQRLDEGLFPVPPDCALDRGFDLADFTGRWYITAGLNKLFDTFDCQVHFFASPEPGKLVGKLNWRIPKGDDFIERGTIQRFVQDAQNPAILYNHDNEYLHYQDDWYVVASKPGQYVFVYYRGQNDAWKGYGGAVVYTKESHLPAEYIPELKLAAESIGLDWNKFVLTNNTCGPHPPQKSLVEEVEEVVAKDVSALEEVVAKDVSALESSLERDLRSFGRGFTVLEGGLISELRAEEGTVAKEVGEAERAIEEMEAAFRRELVAEGRTVEGELMRLRSWGWLQRLGLFR